MSDARDVQVTCPACGAVGTAFVYSSINVTVDPELRDKLFSGELHVLECPRCGQATKIVTSFFYHDMKRQIAVWYLPDATDQEKAAFAKKNMPSFLPMPPYFRIAPIIGSEEDFLQTILDLEAKADVDPPAPPDLSSLGAVVPAKRSLWQRLTGR